MVPVSHQFPPPIVRGGILRARLEHISQVSIWYFCGEYWWYNHQYHHYPYPANGIGESPKYQVVYCVLGWRSTYLRCRSDTFVVNIGDTITSTITQPMVLWVTKVSPVVYCVLGWSTYLRCQSVTLQWTPIITASRVPKYWWLTSAVVYCVLGWRSTYLRCRTSCQLLLPASLHSLLPLPQ